MLAEFAMVAPPARIPALALRIQRDRHLQRVMPGRRFFGLGVVPYGEAYLKAPFAPARLAASTGFPFSRYVTDISHGNRAESRSPW